jgi:hypothetical protein
MKLSITLSDADIKAALVAHAKSSLNISLSDESVTVNLTTGRKGNGASAEIIIGGDTEAVSPSVEPDPTGDCAAPSEVNADTDVDLPSPTPETEGHATPETKNSLFE